MIPRWHRWQFQMADGKTNSAVYPLELYFIRLYVQMAKNHKNHQKSLPSRKCKMSRSQNWSVFSLDGNKSRKSNQNPRWQSALRLYLIYLQRTFLDCTSFSYYYVIEYQRVLNLRNRNLRGEILSTN